MKKFLCVVLVLAIAFAFIGATKQSEEEFTCQYRSVRFSIYRHNATGVCYVTYNGNGMTPLFNADGTLYTGG